jgi:mannose-1-phosphate guanylyltransferase / mannose-6-phosphate isomerase
MTIFPVIMCGGAGTRLWPASRPSKPKQFIALSGNRSLFQETVLRVAPLVEEGGRLIVVAGTAHRDLVVDQLAEVGVDAMILLEPQARGSAPAMAAAAVWVEHHDPEGVIAFVASDHLIPDDEAFRDAILAAAQEAQRGRIVTLGVRPTEPSAAYGYIRTTGVGLGPVEDFVEKPDIGVAADYIAAGYLWNSGNFIVSASTLINELAVHAPDVEVAARAAVPLQSSAPIQVLGDIFVEASNVSIDYAVMEKTDLASVLGVDFRWSDLGAWDAIAASGEGDTGIHIFEDASGCLARAPDGVVIAALGVRNLAIVAEADAILVCDLSRAQDVKRIVERIRTASPRHLDFQQTEPESLGIGARRFAGWMRQNALPTWATLGQTEQGVFAESLSLDGRRFPTPRRARVQARQIFVYAQAGSLGWSGPWRRAVATGLERLYADFLRPDGLCRTTLTADGTSLDETARVYEQAFALFALAAARGAGVQDDTLEARAVLLRDGLLAQAMPNGAFRESGPHPYQSNAHMHLLEASLAWEAVGSDSGWKPLTDRVATLALEVFIDAEGGFIREFFQSDWTPAQGPDGQLVEPGHQFEWAWLLTRYGLARDNASAHAAARKLHAVGRRGVLDQPAVVANAMNDDLTLRTQGARLWPQTEWLKSSLILAEQSHDGERAAYLAEAAAAMRALWLYLTPDGLWHDKPCSPTSFTDAPSPASSFYHIMAAFQQIAATAASIEIEGLSDASLL